MVGASSSILSYLFEVIVPALSAEGRGVSAVIKLTRLSGEGFILNAELIRYVESRPDTFITLTSGERLVVTESMEEVLGRAIEYQQTKYLLPPVNRRSSEKLTQAEKHG